jgi:hypothetical protein
MILLTIGQKMIGFKASGFFLNYSKKVLESIRDIFN